MTPIEFRSSPVTTLMGSLQSVSNVQLARICLRCPSFIQLSLPLYLGKHADALDDLGRGFTTYALEHLAGKYSDNFGRHDGPVRDVMHLLRLGNGPAGGDNFAWSLPTTCGYAPILHKSRQASAWFHYHRCALHLGIHIFYTDIIEITAEISQPGCRDPDPDECRILQHVAQ